MDYTSFAPGNNSINNQKPIPSVFSPAPQKNFTPKFISLIVLLLLLGGGAYAGIWYWQNQQVTQEVVPTFTPRADAIAGWKTYMNTQYGFEFKYPAGTDIQGINAKSSWPATSEDDDLLVGTFFNLIASNPLGYCSDLKTSETIVACLDSPAWAKSDTWTPVVIGGENAVARSSEGSNTVNMYYVNHGKTGLQISVSDSAQGNPIVSQILSTFKFTNSASLNTYQNNQYGFSIALPDSWKGYTVLNSQWTGDKASDIIDHGSIITLRHPLWTTANPREDMPIMIFTTMQWASVQSESMYLGAAPFPPSILGQNSKYVIALPARYNYDFKIGWEEVDQLVHTLKAFEPVVK